MPPEKCEYRIVDQWKTEIAVKFLQLINHYDLGLDYIHTNSVSDIIVNCNDVFFWACGDGECIESQEDLDLLESCIRDIRGIESLFSEEPFILFCARKRKLRPQGAYFGYINPENIELFKAAGPERLVDFGNPYTIEEGIERKKRRDEKTVQK